MKHKYLMINLKSDLHALPSALSKILDFLSIEANLSDEQLLEYKLIISELIINAIIHGNKKDPTKSVKVRVGVYGRRVSYIVVEDEGNGFEMEKVSQKYSPFDFQDEIEDLYEYGRGLMLVSSLCERVKQNDRGNKVVAIRSL